MFVDSEFKVLCFMSRSSGSSELLIVRALFITVGMILEVESGKRFDWRLLLGFIKFKPGSPVMYGFSVGMVCMLDGLFRVGSAVEIVCFSFTSVAEAKSDCFRLKT